MDILHIAYDIICLLVILALIFIIKHPNTKGTLYHIKDSNSFYIELNSHDVIEEICDSKYVTFKVKR